MLLSRSEDSSGLVFGVDVRNPRLIKGQMAIREVRKKTVGLLRGSFRVNSTICRTVANKECTELVIGRKSMSVAGNRLILSDSGSIIGILDNQLLLETKYLGEVKEGSNIDFNNCIKGLKHVLYKQIGNKLYATVAKAYVGRDNMIFVLGETKNPIGRIISN